MRSSKDLEAGRILERPGMSAVTRVALPIVSLGVLIVTWQVLVVTGVVSEFVLPPPTEVASALADFSDPIASATWVTLTEALAGFIAAMLGGLVLAIALTYSRVINAALYPPLLIFHAVPKAALAPILLIWFGFGLAPKVVLSFMLGFFPIVIATVSGLRTVDPELHELARSLHAPWWRTFWKIDFPHALPSFFAGLKVAIHLALVGAVIGEFVSGGEGLAALMSQAGSQFLTELAFAVAMVLSVLSATLFGLVVIAERLVVPWSKAQ